MTNEDIVYEDKYDYLLNIINGTVEIDGKEVNLKTEFEKFFVRGNKSAGIRIRKIMQMLRRTAEEIRDDVQSYKKNI